MGGAGGGEKKTVYWPNTVNMCDSAMHNVPISA